MHHCLHCKCYYFLLTFYNPSPDLLFFFLILFHHVHVFLHDRVNLVSGGLLLYCTLHARLWFTGRGVCTSFTATTLLENTKSDLSQNLRLKYFREP